MNLAIKGKNNFLNDLQSETGIINNNQTKLKILNMKIDVDLNLSDRSKFLE